MSNWKDASTTVVISVYRPRVGQADRLAEIVRKHAPTLRAEGLITDRPVTVAVAEDGSFIEVFEWTSLEAADLAHSNPNVQVLWEEMGQIADFATLSSLAEAQRPFSPFKPF
ncbi:hypothetical protein JJB07_03970 [Tumebacillus sp. ITR2]|uniref:ABM domain-containing protein n=1 Tax=Tumebacillus amylolyticus TaxID=2801339 RepID=A0ABS1J820_9BACL|nr:hypothetical protein [Tumebacillus amylolyticus]MBL0385798.1 hypothetical protein [Tumebacillus amylolyticus]